MLSRPYILGIAGLTVLAAFGGYLWGRASLPPSETDAINRLAAQYVAQTGGQASDCLARPGPEGVAWLTVYCEGEAGQFSYPIDRRGRHVEITEGGI
ncbi:MAG: hypothetical protein AAGA70_12570 [Pseudomonadota bacterium]